ncbi:MAG TPA: DotU family type IV/VI secretion system protein [Terriglobales bacterium]|nr:DotU family type IV/VI secretion system protein [Terriglobales bacterium]
MPAEAIERRSNLALSFQEIFTAIVRLRFNRQAVSSADSFREHMRNALRTASQEAVQKGYNVDDVKLAAFAVIAFLDESVLASTNAVFSTWSRLPFQEELFGQHMGGEAFFQYVQQLLARRDSAETADVLEVFHLGLLLGYRGRYGMGSSGELHGVMDSIRDKIHRIRGSNAPLSPQWAIPAEAAPPRRSDPWVSRMVMAAVATAAITLVAYAAFLFGLISGASTLHGIAG